VNLGLVNAAILRRLSAGEGETCDGGNVEIGAPARCDGCGREAAEAGMVAHGWVVSPLSAAVPGSFCLRCASALRMLDWFVRCVECGNTIESESAAEESGWRFFPDPLGQLQPRCTGCSALAGWQRTT
jgi:hypothetical protein